VATTTLIIRYIFLMLANKNNTWIKYSTPILAVHTRSPQTLI